MACSHGMEAMKFSAQFFPEKITYTGLELRPHWIAERTKSFGNALVAFRGACRVDTSELVDVEDSQAGAIIKSEEMLHFIGESFDGNLMEAVVRQRLLIALFLEELCKMLRPEVARGFLRKGNDLFYQSAVDGKLRKLSVSIVTASPVSTLLHFGVNIDPSGAPVAAIGLKELSVDPELLAKNVLQAWSWEVESIEKARCKVSPR